MFKTIKVFISSLAFLILASTTYVFASQADLPGQAGEGAGTVGGFIVSALNYRLGTDPTLVEAIELDLDKAASTVSIKTSTSTQIYSACTNVYENHWYCNLNNVSISAIDEIQVVALGD